MTSMSRALEQRRNDRRLARLDKGWSVKDEQLGLEKFNLQDPYIAELLRRKQEKIKEELKAKQKLLAPIRATAETRKKKAKKKKEKSIVVEPVKEKSVLVEPMREPSIPAEEEKEKTIVEEHRAILRTEEDIQLAYEVGHFFAELKGLIDDNMEINEAHSEISSDLDFALWSFERRLGRSQFVWKIENFQKKYDDAASGQTPIIYSPSFKTHAYGYSLCLNICPNGDNKVSGKYLSLFFSLMKGTHDPLLPWPFNYKIRFSIEQQLVFDLYHLEGFVSKQENVERTETEDASNVEVGDDSEPVYIESDSGNEVDENGLNKEETMDKKLDDSESQNQVGVRDESQKDSEQCDKDSEERKQETKMNEESTESDMKTGNSNEASENKAIQNVNDEDSPQDQNQTDNQSAKVIPEGNDDKNVNSKETDKANNQDPKQPTSDEAAATDVEQGNNNVKNEKTENKDSTDNNNNNNGNGEKGSGGGGGGAGEGRGDAENSNDAAQTENGVDTEKSIVPAASDDIANTNPDDNSKESKQDDTDTITETDASCQAKGDNQNIEDDKTDNADGEILPNSQEKQEDVKKDSFKEKEKSHLTNITRERSERVKSAVRAKSGRLQKSTRSARISNISSTHCTAELLKAMQPHVMDFVPDLNDKKVLKHLQRPKLARNPCLGFPCFIPLEKLWSGGFVKNDTLYIKVTIDLKDLPLFDPVHKEPSDEL